MDNLHSLMESYLYYCHMQKRLDEKTRKAYCIDLRQFSENIPTKEVAEITPETLENRKKKDCDFKSIFSLSGIQGYS